jgi:hypothetical protein
VELRIPLLTEKCKDHGRPWESMGGGVNDKWVRLRRVEAMGGHVRWSLP